MFIKIITLSDIPVYININKILEIYENKYDNESGKTGKYTVVALCYKERYIKIAEKPEQLIARIEKQVENDPILSRFNILDL